MLKMAGVQKAFLDEGRLAVIEQRLGEGDFLFIQFGHNDEKSEDPSRYTDPFSSFMENLEIYINTARKKGAFPVLITPVERRCFCGRRTSWTGSPRGLCRGDEAHGPEMPGALG